jgi:hypothetical protein
MVRRYVNLSQGSRIKGEVNRAPVRASLSPRDDKILA